MTCFYEVLTRHGRSYAFATLTEAESYAEVLEQGYVEGTHFGNDPLPVIRKITYLKQLKFNKVSKAAEWKDLT